MTSAGPPCRCGPNGPCPCYIDALSDRPDTIAVMAAKKKASGVNIPEAQRGTVAVKLRLPPDVAEDLDELAARWGLTRSGTVARLLEERADRSPHDPQKP
jgi:hypothetical protein